MNKETLDDLVDLSLKIDNSLRRMLTLITELDAEQKRNLAALNKTLEGIEDRLDELERYY